MYKVKLYVVKKTDEGLNFFIRSNSKLWSKYESGNIKK